MLPGLPVLAIMTTFGMGAFTIVAWRRGFWSRWRRVRPTMVTAGVLVFTAILGYRNLLGWQFYVVRKRTCSALIPGRRVCRYLANLFKPSFT